MKKASEYRQHAEECRVLARRMPDGEHRRQLEEMARTWDHLAAEREAQAGREATAGRAAEDGPDPAADRLPRRDR